MLARTYRQAHKGTSKGQDLCSVCWADLLATQLCLLTSEQSGGSQQCVGQCLKVVRVRLMSQYAAELDQLAEWRWQPVASLRPARSFHTHAYGTVIKLDICKLQALLSRDILTS